MLVARLPLRVLGAVVALCLAAPLLGPGTAPALAQGEDQSEAPVTSSAAEADTEEPGSEAGTEDVESDQETPEASTDAAGATTVDGWAELNNAVAGACDHGGMVVLGGSIDAPAYAGTSGEANLDVTPDCEITLDLAGHTLTVTDPGPLNAAVRVHSSASLTIIDSSPGEEGSLIANGGNQGAGIGGRSNGDGGEVIITGGTVTATGGIWAAGIGGGGSGAGGTVTIAGGTVTATGNHGAGIGGGGGGAGGTVTIESGTVTATGGGFGGAGIGGGGSGHGGTVMIAGGQVTAAGGGNGAGIGGGHGGDGGTVTMGGGTVTATSSGSGAAVGTGRDGGGPGSLEVLAVLADDSAQDGGPGLEAGAPWISSAAGGDLYARAITDQNANGGGVFELSFGRTLILVDLALDVDDGSRELRQFVAFGDVGTVPDQPQVWDGYTATGWRDAAPAGEVVTGPVVVDDGSVRVYSTAARASLSTETITAGESAIVTVSAVDEVSEPVDVTEDAEITLDGEHSGASLSPSTPGTYDIEVEYLGATFTFELTVLAGEAASLLVEGPRSAVETETVFYSVEAFDAEGNPLGDLTADTQITSDVPADEVAGNQVSFAFTPEGLTDRELSFTYIGEDDQEITETVPVEVTSAVEGVTLDVPEQAGHGESVTVTVTALNEDDEPLGEVTSYTAITSDHHDDVFDTEAATLTFIGAGSREITASYRGHEDNAEVDVGRAATEVSVVAEADTVTAGDDVVLDVTVDSMTSGIPVVTGEVQVWKEDADLDEDSPLAVGTVSDGRITVPVAGLTDAGEHGLVVRYTGTEDFAVSTSDPLEVTVEPAAPASISVDGPTGVTETETRAYLTESYDEFGNRIGFVTGDTTITSDVPADEVTGNQVGFTFTPHALTDRELTFTYTGEDDQEIIAMVGVSVDSAVQEIELSVAPVRAAVGTTVEVSVEAFDADGESLGEMTEHAAVTFEGDPVDGAEFTIPSAGNHQLEAVYRDVIDDHVVIGEIAVLETLGVTGDGELTETQTGTYEISGTDQFGDPISVDFQNLAVASSESADSVTVDEESSQVHVEFAFTPAGPSDRALTFAYEVDDTVADEVEIAVEIDSALRGLDLHVPLEVADRETVPVTVTALDAEGEALGVVTSWSGISSDGEEDEIADGALRVTGVGERTVSASYRGQTATASVQVVPAAAGALVVTGPSAVTETETVVYTVEVFDDYGNSRGIPAMEAGDVTSSVAGDRISITEGGDVEITFAFTPDELVDRELGFTYETDDQLLMATEEVGMTSAVQALAVEASATADVGQAVAVSVQALDGVGESLGEVTSDAVLSSSVQGDVVEGNEITLVTAGERTLTAAYRDLTGTTVVDVTAVVGEEEGEGPLAATGSSWAHLLPWVALLLVLGALLIVLVNRRESRRHGLP